MRRILRVKALKVTFFGFPTTTNRFIDELVGVSDTDGVTILRSVLSQPCYSFQMTDEAVKRKSSHSVVVNLQNASPLLREGKITRTYHVQASGLVHEWFAVLTAEDRGALLAQSMIWQDRSVPVVQALDTPVEINAVKSTLAQIVTQICADPLHPSGEVLRWSGAELSGLSVAQAKILGHLRSGAVLVRKGVANQWSLCWPDGRVKGAGTPSVRALRRAGLLQAD